MFYLFSLLLGASLVSSPTFALETYTKSSRIEYLSKALKAVYQAGVPELEQTYNQMVFWDRTRCSSPIERLRISCHMESITRWCQQPNKNRSGCPLYSDILLINKLGEERLISSRERYELMRVAKNYRQQMRQELTQLYATLALNLYLSERLDCDLGTISCLATGIDQFCMDYNNRHGLSWQYCAAGIIWFVGTTTGAKPKGY